MCENSGLSTLLLGGGSFGKSTGLLLDGTWTLFVNRESFLLHLAQWSFKLDIVASVLEDFGINYGRARS